MEEHKLSLSTAILININVMLGAGIFLNTANLAQGAGALGFLAYVLVGLLMLPLILSMVKLLQLHPTGGFYVFGREEVNPFFGFFGTWSYFVGKLASATVMIHASVLLIQQIIPMLGKISPYAIDCGIIGIFVALNTLNLKAGSKIQTGFLIFKTVPIFFAILVGLFLFNPGNFVATNLIWTGIAGKLPLVIFALSGFEAAISLSSQIKDPRRNAPLAVLCSYLIVATIAALYQFAFYGAVGDIIGSAGDYRTVFPALLGKILPAAPEAVGTFTALLHLAIASSALGGSYGILFSNAWNLHMLATKGHLFASHLFTRFNKHLIPVACVLLEGLICLTYLFVSSGVEEKVQITRLQSIGATGNITAYTLSVLALFIGTLRKKELTNLRWLPAAGLVSCSMLIGFCINGFLINGITPLIAFALLVTSGCAMFFCTRRSYQ